MSDDETDWAHFEALGEPEVRRRLAALGGRKHPGDGFQPQAEAWLEYKNIEEARLDAREARNVARRANITAIAALIITTIFSTIAACISVIALHSKAP